MPDTCTIRRFHAAYRLPESRTAEGARLDGILRQAVEEDLEAALDRAGLTGERLIAIRRVHVPVRLKLASTDTTLAMAWSLAISDAIRRQVDTLSGAEPVPSPAEEGVVAYPTRLRALHDMASRALAGDFRRLWAWERIALWEAGAPANAAEAVARLVRLTSRDVELLAPLLELLAASGHLAGLVARLDAGAWRALADAVLASAGRSEGIAALMEAIEAMEAHAAPPAARLLEGSRVAPALMGMAMPQAACAAVVLLAETEPAALRLPLPRLAPLAAAIAAHLSGHPAAEGRRAAARSAQRPRVGAYDDAGAVSAAETTDGVLAPRREGLTQYGGLLFLPRLLDVIGLPDRMLAALPERPFRWVLHRLALTLLPLASSDPAALAFCGLLPGDDPPDRDATPAAPSEEECFLAWRAEIVEALASRLASEPRTETALLHFVCQRPARIVADPGWFEVRFSLATVSTRIRRAGLDLDPGWIPWLGAVLRFVYE